MCKKSSNWYECIESDIREHVRLLRDNGFNTECSCAHKMYIQLQVMEVIEIDRLDNLLFNHGERDYIIELELKREQGFIHTTATIYFAINGRFPVQIERQNAMEQA